MSDISRNSALAITTDPQELQSHVRKTGQAAMPSAKAWQRRTKGKAGFTKLAVGVCALAGLPGCTGAVTGGDQVQLEISGPPIDPQPDLTSSWDFYRVPRPTGDGPDGGRLAQAWAMLGREDRGAASGSDEYRPRPCEPITGASTGWDEVADEIAAHAADHRIVIINESHQVTRHRETTRMILTRLKPLGFNVLAAEAFVHFSGPNSPINDPAAPAWPRLNDGSYLREPVFGRLVREAKALGYRLSPYEEIFDYSAPQSEDMIENITRRETAQAEHLAAILRDMAPDERLIVHVGYSHAAEVAISRGQAEVEWMAARLKALTGIDPLTIAQTVCSHESGPVFLARPPEGVRPGQFDMIVSHPVADFVDSRPNWRRERGDINVPIPAGLRPTENPLVVEAYAWGEPFEAVPVDRIFVEPGEDLPLLLPPGRYRLRAVRVANP